MLDRNRPKYNNRVPTENETIWKIFIILREEMYLIKVTLLLFFRLLMFDFTGAQRL